MAKADLSQARILVVPILVLTADATGQARKRALEAGAKDTRHLDLPEVQQVVHRMLAAAGGTAAGGSPGLR